MAPEPQTNPESIAPHGGLLVERTINLNLIEDVKSAARGFATLTLSQREMADLGLIAVGALSPLTGFMAKADYESVISEMRLADGTVWSLPITLSANSAESGALKGSKYVALLSPEGDLLATLEIEEIYTYDKEREAQLAFGTTDEAHPGVAAVYRQKEFLVGGSVDVIRLPNGDPSTEEYEFTPVQTRAAFAKRGWRTIVGFQTRNPVHRAHEYIQKSAMEIVDGLLLHPLVGETKSDDIPADVRMKCYEVLLENYYPSDRVFLSALPAAMRYAGPREAVFHAIVRKNYGCTHFIVGRDHAGVGGYYGSYDAQELLRSLSLRDLGITPLFFDNSFYCSRCGGMASTKTCPHDATDRLSLSGTEVRRMLGAGELPPPEFTRPEVAEILIDASKGTI